MRILEKLTTMEPGLDATNIIYFIEKNKNML